MNEPQISGSSAYTPAPTGVFGTKIPSAVTFTIGVLLFLLPFAELKCKAPEEKQNSLLNLSKINMSFTNTGLGLAFGSDWKTNMSSLGGLFNDNQRENDWKKDMKPQKPNYYAIAALALAIIGLGLSFTGSRSWIAVSGATGVLAVGALIGLMIDLNNQSKDLVAETQKAGNSFSMSEGAGFTLNFTPWFYVAMIALAAAAFFSYKRMQSLE